MNEIHSHSPLMPSAKRRNQRASYVCKVCQERKVRCDLSFRDPPCTNCRMDGTECSLPEYRRRRYTPNKKCAIAKLRAERNAKNRLNNTSIMVDRETLPFGTTETLAPCFKRMPESLGTTELSYLEKKGAFEVPPPNLLRQLLTAYLQFAYGYMPIVDLHALLGSFVGVPSTAISWLLFQCIMFAGIAFVDVLDLEAAGFNSRGEAHDYYFDKARLLYDFDCEQDPLTVIQALAMMSHWNQRNKSHKGSLYWLESSLSLAFKHGLHREDLADLGIMQNDGLRKRVWWSLYSQSKIVSLGMSFPLRYIHKQEFNVSSLSLADFDFEIFPSVMLDLLPECSIIRRIEEQESLARMFLQKIRICLPEQMDYESSPFSSDWHSAFDPDLFLEAWAEDDFSERSAPTANYSEKWYQPIKDERSSFPASYLSLSPIGKAARLYQLHLRLLWRFPRRSSH